MSENDTKQNFLTRLLVALCRQSGELRVGAEILEQVQAGSKLFVDYDAALKEYVLRAGSRSGDMLTVGEPAQRSLWTEKQKETSSPPEPERSQSSPPKRQVVLTDGLLAEVEEKLVERANRRRTEKRDQDYRRAIQEMYSGESAPRS